MQTYVRKLGGWLLLLWLAGGWFAARAQSVPPVAPPPGQAATTLPPAQADALLAQADSLFAQGRYRRAYLLYEEVWQQARRYSPQMLLRMAFVQEGMGNYPEALYFLNVYFLHHPDRPTVEKMRSLAEKNGLDGYRFNEIDFALAWYYQYRGWFLVAMLLGAALMLVTMVRYRRQGERTFFHALFLLLFLGAAFYVLNYGDTYRKGIVQADQTYLMEAPSAGASVHRVVKKGQRLTVKGQSDVWWEVEINGETAFVHRSRLRLVEA